jgi:hypothetical protein
MERRCNDMAGSFPKWWLSRNGGRSPQGLSDRQSGADRVFNLARDMHQRRQPSNHAVTKGEVVDIAVPQDQRFNNVTDLTRTRWLPLNSHPTKSAA